jgi:hypothetical protein
MKKAVLGALAGIGLAMAVFGAMDHHGEVFAGRLAAEYAGGPANGVLAIPGPAVDDGQLLTVIDPSTKAIGVYHIASPSGKITLRSVRNIHWDLQMTYLNNESPLPQEIQSLLPARR